MSYAMSIAGGKGSPYNAINDVDSRPVNPVWRPPADPEDILQLYNMVPLGTEVRVVKSGTPFAGRPLTMRKCTGRAVSG
jgi:hypothetical protein